ncbi:MAG: hypothetical protein PHI36_07445 [Bacteroidales bacterium]|nr:hypothetical protein [Bacteroidales bacterium]
MNQLVNIAFDFNVESKILPKNIYALRVFDENTKLTHDIFVKHDGYCPNLTTEREQSNFNDYLSNLENYVTNEFFRINDLKTPKNYHHLIEVMTNDNGELYHLSKTID